MNPAQRPRTVLARPQLHRELVKEVTHPASHDVLNAHAINARRPAVSPNLTPRSAHNIAAGDLVKQSMETTTLILLDTTGQHALATTNPVPADSEADRSSRYDTHQSPSHPSRAPMKCEPLPTWPAFPTPEYYDPL